MQNVYSIATKPSYFARLLNTEEVYFDIRYQARPGMLLPVIIGSKLINAVWGMDLPGGKDVCSQIHMKRMFKDKEVTHMIRNQRCVVPANCFIVKRSEPRLVRVLKQRVFGIGGVYQRNRTRNTSRYHFALLQTEPADMLSSYCDEMPVCFAIDRWMDWTSECELSEIMQRADRSSQLWYDHFPVSDQVLDSYVNDRELLRPIGLSHIQRRERRAALDNIKLDDWRSNSGGKH